MTDKGFSPHSSHGRPAGRDRVPRDPDPQAMAAGRSRHQGRCVTDDRRSDRTRPTRDDPDRHDPESGRRAGRQIRYCRALAGWRPGSFDQRPSCRDARSDGHLHGRSRWLGRRARSIVLDLRRTWRDRCPRVASRAADPPHHRAEDRARRHQRSDGCGRSQAAPGYDGGSRPRVGPPRDRYMGRYRRESDQPKGRCGPRIRPAREVPDGRASDAALAS